jgi:hypothetical protein
MKKNITLSLDYEAYLNAKSQMSNVSEYVSECLRSFSNKNDDSDNFDAELKEVDKVLTDNHIKKSIILASIKSRDENNAKKALELAESEQYKRWVCNIPLGPAKTPCGHKNFMSDEIRCTKCGTKSRSSVTTTYIDIRTGDAI